MSPDQEHDKKEEGEVEGEAVAVVAEEIEIIRHLADVMVDLPVVEGRDIRHPWVWVWVEGCLLHHLVKVLASLHLD